MITTIVNLLYISFICVLIIDFSGIIDTIKSLIKRTLKINGEIRLKPFDCSLCATWWCSLIYLISINEVTLNNIFLALFFSILTPVFYSIILFVRETLITVINYLNKMNSI